VGASEAVAALVAHLEAKPGAHPDAMPLGVRLYKVMGKMFAILTDHRVQSVTVKCDPHLIEVLKEKYAGVGHRGHLDRRFWINVNLDADVPLEETCRLVDHSYDLICAGLTRKQRAELAGVAG
jgi:predicted DNA-binding protein (MmcQ/YjbR family)